MLLDFSLFNIRLPIVTGCNTAGIRILKSETQNQQVSIYSADKQAECLSVSYYQKKYYFN